MLLDEIFSPPPVKVKKEQPVEEEQQLDELMFMGLSPCTKDCSGHRAGYKWSRKRNRSHASSWSDSFNRGAAIAAAGY